MQKSEYVKGLAAVISAMLIWGVLPIYWQTLVPISSWVIILYRIVLVCVYSLIAARFVYSFKEIFEPLKDKKIRRMYFAAGAFVTVNWSVYIYGVNSNQVVQCALGYYIEPLMICLIGIIVFHEKVTRFNLIAMILATISVVVLVVHFGEIPKLALLIPITFAIYTAIKKSGNLPPLISLVYETMLFVPPALIAIIYLEVNGKGALSVATPGQYAALFLCGLFTLIPLGLFAFSTQRCPMFHLGLAEYVSPTVSLIVGVTCLGESVDMVQIMCFVLIWIGLVIFSAGEYRQIQKG